jgi:hypothetical protein
MRLITLRGRASRARRIIALSVVVAFATLTSSPALAQGRRAPANYSVIPITITGVAVENGGLVVNGLVGSNPFQTPLTITPQQSAGACPILNLQLGPIDLNLLGLRVQTSQICLDVTAVEGGGLLGDLLCEVANLLQGGTPLTDVLALLQGRSDLTRFLAGLTSLLDEVFDRLTANTSLNGATCEILSLALGPIELNLLGLVVELDNCANGPVTLDITAIPGGGLLGDLLCSLSDLLNGRAAAVAINTVLFQISRLLGQLVG